MKKEVGKLLFVILVLIVGIYNVNAATLNVGSSFTKSKDYKVSISGLNIGDIGYSIMHYHFNGSDGNSYVGYCMDPHKKAGTNYVIDRILGQGNNRKIVHAYDYGMLEILKNGYTQINNSYSYTIDSNGYTATLTGDELYAATSIAIRSYSLGLFGWGGDVNYAAGQKSASAHISIGLNWSSYFPTATDTATGRNCRNSSAGVLQCYQNVVSSQYAWYKNYKNTTFTWEGIGSVSYKVIYAAQQLFRLGVSKAADYMQNGINEPNVTLTMKNKEIIESSEEKTTEYAHAEFAISNINDANGYIKNVKYTCDTCAAKGITIDSMEYLSESGEWILFNESTDISKMVPLNNGFRNGKLSIRLHITKAVKEEDCSNASFKITYDYYDPNKEYIGALLKTKNENDRQRFLIITKVADTIKGEATGTITCAAPVCETKISVPVCSDDEDEAVATIKAPEKVKTCVLNNNDDAGNTYQLSKNNGGVDNDYCNVFCKEDYAEIRLNPVVDNVVCGGYFQLKAHIQGSKDCYTGGDTTDKSIDKNQYLNDIRNIQEKLVDAMNRYYMYQSMSEHEYDEENVPKSCGGSTCGTRTTIEVEWESYKEVKFIWNNNAGNGSYQYGTHDGGNASWTDSCSCSTCGTKPNTYSCCGGCDNSASVGYNSWKNDVKQGLQTAKNDLTNYMAKYKQIIQDYNACTTAWVNEYLFEQKLKYYYNEYHYENAYEPYYSLLEKADNEELYYLEALEESLNEKSEITICTGEANEKYECQGNSISLSGDVDNEKKDEYNYNSAYGSGVFSARNYVICSVANGCVTDSRQISQATFVKKTVEKEQDYITPTAFYQIAANGKVTVNSGYAGDALQLEALKNSLPVSTSTTGGGVFKLLLEELGEFYDTGDLGRLIDFKGNNEEKSVAQAQSENGIKTFDGNYVCKYKSPCTPKECPNCEFTCEGEDCEWNECPNCKFECINCIFNLSELQLNFKTISTTNVTSANRSYGYNWITNTSIGQLELISDKAELTIKEIEEINDMVYDKTSDESGLAFSIKMTPEITNKVKSYNKSAEGKGGYANDSLTCYDAEVNGSTYKNIYCYSDFIDELIEDYSDSITVYNRLDNNSNRDTATSSSGYWTLWEGYVYSESVIGGPSWK